MHVASLSFDAVCILLLCLDFLSEETYIFIVEALTFGGMALFFGASLFFSVPTESLKTGRAPLPALSYGDMESMSQQ